MLDRKAGEARLNEVKSNLDLLGLLPDIRSNVFAYVTVDRCLTLIEELLRELKGMDIETHKNRIVN